MILSGAMLRFRKPSQPLVSTHAQWMELWPPSGASTTCSSSSVITCPGRDRADDKGETVRRDTSGRVVVFQEVCCKVFGDCSRRVNDGVVSVGDGFRVELVEAHDDLFGRRIAVLFSKLKGRVKISAPECGFVRCLSKPQAAHALLRTLSSWVYWTDEVGVDGGRDSAEYNTTSAMSIQHNVSTRGRRTLVCSKNKYAFRNASPAKEDNSSDLSDR